jgi:DNA-binding response OmpR family regulator
MDPKRWINLERVTVMVLEQSDHGRKITSQILRGFGIRDIHACRSLDEARALTRQLELNLIIADPGALDGEGMEFLRWLRRANGNVNRFVPIILASGHSTGAAVILSRDAGANFFVARPFTPKVLLDRIMFVARDKRPYVEAEAMSVLIAAGKAMLRRAVSRGAEPATSTRRSTKLTRIRTTLTLRPLADHHDSCAHISSREPTGQSHRKAWWHDCR